MDDYVSFEIAKKLKEKGFNEYSDMSYTKIGLSNYTETYKESKEFYCYAPTIYQVLKWLRDDKQIYIIVEPFPCMATNNKIYWSWKYKWNSNGIYMNSVLPDNSNYITYEQAILVGIKYVLDILI